MTEPETAHVKGSALAVWFAWYVEHGDPEGLMRAAQQIPVEERGGLDPTSATLGVIPTAWYPTAAVGLVLDRVASTMTVAERTRMVRESTEASVAQSVRGIFKLAFQLLVTPERYAKHIQRFWNQLHDTGVRSVEVVGPGEAVSLIEDWQGHHPLLCEATMETMAAVFRRMGLEDVEVMRVECVSTNDARCKAILRWSS